MKSHDVSNSDDIIDSRDIIARLDELDTELRDAYERYTDTADEDEETTRTILPYEEWLDSEDNTEQDTTEEYKALKSFADEAEGYASDWKYGAALIRDSYFEEYAEQFADDIGAVNKDANWPTNHIDWKAAAEDLQQDYNAVEFDGVTYWVR
jgi:hypothetical protein